MSNSRSDRFDAVFKALGHSTRRSILDTLRDQPMTTGALATLFPDIDRCTVMQHLRVLQDADLIHVERKGRERWNYLNPLPIHDLHERWIGPHAVFAVSRLAAMKRNLEKSV
jgi:DNA-binding transcriptional ArsR family regulator